MHFKVLVDMLFIRSDKPEMELRYIVESVPHFEKDDVVNAIMWAEGKGLFIVRRSHATLYVKSSPEGKVFFSILRELVKLAAGNHG